MPWEGRIRWREFAPDRQGEFVGKGHRQRSFFPHRVVFLPRPGPDGYKLAEWMCGERDASHLWQAVLFADEAAVAEFPAELFFDEDLVWHQQHFGRDGHICYADIVLAGTDMWSMSHVSDVVQRIGRRREHKTRIETVFKGWHDLLLNALLGFAVDRGVRRLHVPTSQLQIKYTDPARRVQPELFERVYDRSVNRLFAAVRAGDWWLVDVATNRERVVLPTAREERLFPGRTVCVCHDVEAGLGHEGYDRPLAVRADRDWRKNVAAMLRIEREAGVRATYNVVGRLLRVVRAEIEAGGHCLAFHSYDHRIDHHRRLPRVVRRLFHGPQGMRVAGLAAAADQLAACRRVDYRIKGYRAPQSRITSELADDRLLFHNFAWLASSVSSIGASRPELRNGIVRVPVQVDDFGLYQSRVDFESWRARVLETVAAHDVAVLSLHDCYGHLWLDRYPELLDALSGLGELRTVDEVADEVTLASAV